MTQRQIKCNYCDNGQDILYDRDANPKTTNLDGTHHYHVRHGPQQQPKQETVTISQDVTKPVVTKQEETIIREHLAVTRDKAIGEAHKENMEESKLVREESAKLRTSIDNHKVTLDDVSTQIYNLNKTLSTGFDLLRAYLDARPLSRQNE